MKKTLKAILAGSVALAPLAAFAAIDGTHHDMTPTGLNIGTTEKCAYCHAKTLGANAPAYGKVGAFCVQVCHIAGSGPAGAGYGQVVPDNVETFYYDEVTSAYIFEGVAALDPVTLINGHQFGAAALVTVGGEANQNTMVATNWPHIAAGGTLECTSCHAVHDNTNPPFLNDAYTGFCERCHGTKAGDYTTTTTGNHPTGMAFNGPAALAYDGNDQKTGEAATMMNGRTLRDKATAGRLAPTNVYAGFTNQVVGATPQATANDPGTHWNLAGHVLASGGAGAGVLGLPVQAVGAGSADNRFGCYSCHNAHQDNPTVGLNEVIVAPRTTVSQNVLLVSGLLNAVPLADTSDVCYGCHGYDAVDSDAGKSGAGHPINEETVVSDTNTWVVPMSASGAAGLAITSFANLNTDAPKCLTCHNIHNGVTTGLMSIRYPATANGSACTACHNSSFLPADVGGVTNAAGNAHHPGANATDYTAAANGAFVNIAIPAGAKIAWGTIDNNGNLADGLSCPDCHVGDGTATKRTTAHNWRP